jgi:hypothetical protein
VNLPHSKRKISWDLWTDFENMLYYGYEPKKEDSKYANPDDATDDVDFATLAYLDPDLYASIREKDDYFYVI